MRDKRKAKVLDMTDLLFLILIPTLFTFIVVGTDFIKIDIISNIIFIVIYVSLYLISRKIMSLPDKNENTIKNEINLTEHIKNHNNIS